MRSSTRPAFSTTYLENPSADELRTKLAAFARDEGPQDVALVYFAGSGGIATGMPFLLAADGQLPASAVSGQMGGGAGCRRHSWAISWIRSAAIIRAPISTCWIWAWLAPGSEEKLNLLPAEAPAHPGFVLLPSRP